MILAASVLIDGLSYAMILFLISIGLSMTMGLMRVVNLAHGGFAMVGGYLAATLPIYLGVPYLGAVAIALIAAALLSVPIEKLLIRRFYKRSTMDQMLVTIGLMFVFIASANAIFGSSIVTADLPVYLQGSVDLGFRSVPKTRIAVIVVGVIVVALLWVGVERSSFGIRVRAAVENANIAQAVGIDTPTVYSLVFAFGAALAALGGIAGAEVLPMEPSYASKYLVPALAVVAVGGHGTLIGSLFAALALGITETAAKYFVPDMAQIVFYMTMFLVLLVKPNGIMGHD